MDYGLGDVERLLGLSPSVIRALIRQRFVAPARGQRREYRFSFQDLIALRTARSLVSAGIPRRRIVQSLRDLRRRLPERVPSVGLSIRAVGDRVIVRDGRAEWESSSGQYLLAFDVLVSKGNVRLIEPPGAGAARARPAQARGQVTAEAVVASAASHATATAEELFAHALHSEDRDLATAAALYEHCLALQPAHIAARINLARLRHESGALSAAEDLYRHSSCTSDAVALFNLAVLLEDQARNAEAIDAYTAALAVDPSLADAHYNLARLYELQGNAAHTIRHLRMYRLLARRGSQ